MSSAGLCCGSNLSVNRIRRGHAVFGFSNEADVFYAVLLEGNGPVGAAVGMQQG
jgi:hypothetical protein